MRSTLAGETLAMSDGIDKAIFHATLFSELTPGSAAHAPPIICVTDSAKGLKSTKSISEKILGLEISGRTICSCYDILFLP